MKENKASIETYNMLNEKEKGEFNKKFKLDLKYAIKKCMPLLNELADR